MALRCVIVDDQPSFCEAARDLLEGQGVAVVGSATSSAGAVRLVQELRPEIALVDINLGAESGFDLARRLAADSDGATPKVILISTHDEREYMKLVESSPAVGFLSKTELSAERIYQLLDRGDEVLLRCLIVDDQPSFCEAARDLLEGQGVAVVGSATSSAGAVRLVQELRPEIALVDIDLGVESGFDLARRLAADLDGDTPKVILISTHDEREFMKLVESSPAVGFLSKTELSAERIYQLLDRGE